MTADEVSVKIIASYALSLSCDDETTLLQEKTQCRITFQIAAHSTKITRHYIQTLIPQRRFQAFRSRHRVA